MTNMRSPLLQERFEQGYTLYTQGREAEALLCFDDVIQASPNDWQARNNRAVLLQNFERYGEALVDAQHLLTLDSTNVGTLAMLGRILLRLNRYAESLSCYERIRALDPGYPLDDYEEAFCRLMLGDYAKGWLLHEARWRTSSMQKATMQHDERGYAQPLWLGQELLMGKTILLWPEQGHGDTLQFCRYVPLVAQKGVKVILAAHTATHRLLKESFAHLDVDVVLDVVTNPYIFDCHCPLMSLPLACGTDSFAKIPVSIPYLSAPSADVQRFAECVMDKTLQQTLRVGLAWAGGTRHGSELQNIDVARSMQLQQFAPLLALSENLDVQFFSLQLGDPAKQLHDDCPVIDFTAQLHDWADTAALIANLDLVISVDTAVAHLAAAMGKPTWILSRYNGCWRWLDQREDSPWYPTVRLFRQKTRGDWNRVISEVQAALQAWIAS